MGVREILTEWCAFRVECVRRGIYFELERKGEKLHLLRGLEKILLDIDKAIETIRQTDEEREVVPNLMIEFGIDKIQADYVAEIKLRHLNKEYILNRTGEIENLINEMKEMEDTLANPLKVRRLIIKDLRRVMDKYGAPRKTDIMLPSLNDDNVIIDEVPDYPVHLFFTKEGYFKKITPASLRMSSEHKLKEGDSIDSHIETTNRAEIIFFTDKCQAYKTTAAEFSDSKASVIGDFVPSKLAMDEGERTVSMIVFEKYEGSLVIFFENGKCAKVDFSTFETKTKRKKLMNAMSDKSPLVAMFYETEPQEYAVKSSALKMLIVNSAMVPIKQTKSTQGVAVMTLRRNAIVEEVVPLELVSVENPHRYRSKNLPAAGSAIAAEDISEQLEL